jgi:hypothetical protein
MAKAKLIEHVTRTHAFIAVRRPEQIDTIRAASRQVAARLSCLPQLHSSIMELRDVRGSGIAATQTSQRAFRPPAAAAAAGLPKEGGGSKLNACGPGSGLAAGPGIAIAHHCSHLITVNFADLTTCYKAVH